MEFQGSVKKITYYNQENGYGVVRVEVSNDEIDKILEEVNDDSFYSNTITVCSTFTTLPFIDQLYDFSGHFEENKYGLQFISDKTVKAFANTEKGIVAYLSSDNFKGIGAKTAAKIYKKLGQDALKLIIKDKSVLDDIDIKDKQKDLIYNNLVENYKVEEDVVELLSLGLSLKMASKIIKSLGDKALSTVLENPYALIGLIEGIGFIRADEIALKIGIKKDSPHRIKALIVNTLHEIIYNDGDTYINVNELYLNCVKIINKEEEILNKDNFSAYLQELVDDKKVLLDEDNNVYDCVLAFHENELARIIVNHLNYEEKLDYDKDKIESILKHVEEVNNIEYNDKQKNAIINALLENISIITGGPGTGKSTIVKGIIEIYKELNNGIDNIKLVAPTGRAAKRLRELCYHDASTIHKLLGYTGSKFMNDEVDASLIIIDEFSMVDIHLAYHLFKALQDHTKIVIVGDADQLPPVGAGDILNDLILSKEISTVKLDKIHRQAASSTIISLAHEVNQGRIPYDLKELKNDRKFISCDDNNIISLSTKTIDLYLNQMHLKDNDDEDTYASFIKEKEALVNDIQILVPMYKGSVGIDAFNHHMQEHFNPLTKSNPKQIKLGTKCFRVYDKVIQLNNRSEKNVMNGDIGYIVSIDMEDNIYSGLSVRFPFGDVKYEMDELDDLSLAYAISIHKAQGSEFKLVIVPFSFKYYIMLKKKLIYTAITRAKKYLIMIGNTDAIRKGIINVEEKRKTKLQERIKTLIDNPNHIFSFDSAFDEIKMENQSDDGISPYDFMDIE